MKVLGLDPSLTAFGWACTDAYGTIASRRRGPERLVAIRDEMLRLVDRFDPDLVALEGYSFGAKGRAVVSLGELGGVIRTALYEEDRPYVELAPSVVKKWATGSGNASKEAVLAAAIRRLGYRGHSPDEADALWIASVGEAAVGLPHPDGTTAKHRDALKSVEMPEGVADAA